MTNPNLTFKRGNIVLVLFPDSNLRSAKPRPAIIVQADKLATIATSEIGRVIGTLPMSNVDVALQHTLGL